ncbi:M6 family metalloprotease domain-containing protein [Segatella copri]|uniref:M6 family metalloprotease domain-containing protein n=1 Tax=Segatella copri TaxID=165179 RepID=A0AA93BBT3_9BACT|nr:M6 family metalloprotease domain-containing protein [Segatella copri]RGN08896.1 M6 family metalloprotease domain-containing protein [Segatella copri]RGQ09438.1 M6 family metalloprotease domain-containing protein [Segatella copri]
MKKIIIFSLLVVCFVQTTFAIPAYPKPLKVKQADGSWLTIQMRGDEHGHYVLTSDGIPLVFNARQENYEYADWKDGKVQASGIKAVEASERTAKVKAFVESLDKSAILESFKRARLQQLQQTLSSRRNASLKAGSNPQKEKLNNFPTIGEVHSLVILVQFADTKFSTVGSDAHQFFNNMLNEPGFTYSNGANGSARDFYLNSSNGRFQPQFDVIGPVTLPEKYSYYGANQGSSVDNPARLEQFVREACTLADPLVDFSQYDHNQDGYIDNIYFFYAGKGEADSGDGNAIWPHSAYYSDMAKDAGLSETSLKLDGIEVGNYTCSNEINGTLITPQPAGIGTFVHEFGHVLGLADHYDVNYGMTTFAPGSFDTMAQASYNNNGNTPAAFSAYERACLGWLDLTVLKNGVDSLNVLPDLNDSNKAYVVPVGGTNDEEYFIMENRQKKGWDAFIPGHGMLLWHIDYDAKAWEKNELNITGTHQRVDIVEADNKLTDNTRAGDPFPGTSNVTQCNLTSWAGGKVMSLDDIEEKDGIINLMLGGLNLKLNTPDVKVTEVQDSSIVVGWTDVPVAKRYVLNISSVVNGKKESLPLYNNKVYTAAQPSLHVEGLSPETTYEITLQANRGSYSSDVYTQQLTTAAIPFSKYYVTDVKATAVGKTGFTASWKGMEAADDYVVTLHKLVYATEATQKGYDFSKELDGMPSLWETNGNLSMNNYGEESPCLRLNKIDTYLKMASAGNRISSVKFFAKSSSSTKATLAVEAYQNGEWKQIATLQGGADMASGDTYSYDLPELADSVRLNVIQRTSGAFYIDDVLLGCNALIHEPVAAYQKVSTNGKTEFAFSGLETDATYALVVNASKKGELSYSSKELIVTPASSTGISSVTATPSRNGQKRFYDLNGRRVSAKEMRHGIYIVKQGNSVYKIVR